jgi:hypothetical protein
MFFLLDPRNKRGRHRTPGNSAGQAKNQEQTIYNAFVQLAMFNFGTG